MEKYLISTGRSRKEMKWKNVEVTWDQLLKRVSETHRTLETLIEYSKMKKPDQDEIKDIGGFVGGHLKEGHRRSGNVLYRTLITLDADFGSKDFWETLIALNDFKCLIYSTHKHSANNPRLRLVIPLNRKVDPEEYEAIARWVAYEIGIDQFDDTTYQATRLMYWPSTSKDGTFVFEHQEGPELDADSILAKYPDWTDVSFWPQSSRVVSLHKNLAKQQQDPLNKPGVVGQFCRSYDVHSAIETFLSDVYTPCDVPDRYTYVKGSTSAGLITYDDKFAYSNHATDPAGQQLCNAFDLVRIHLFGEEDESAKEGLPANKMPSFVKMNDLCMTDDAVKGTINNERTSSALEDFADVEIPKDLDWMKRLDLSKRGQVEPTIDNMMIILQNDPNLANIGGFNEFNYRAETSGKLPWCADKKTRSWNDTDDAGLRHYIEKVYKVSVTNKLDDALALIFEEHKFHPVRQYLDPLVWDEMPRLDTLLIDYLGAEDSLYTRAVTRKTFTAAVARVYHPGVKFDYMLTLTGAQGTGKSTFVKKMAREWYSDSLISIGTKEAYESLQGIWLVEMAELTATKKAEVEAVKQFISKQEDTYRKAYAKRSTVNYRQCVFFGTTNNPEFLRDLTGNRRFWPIDVQKEKPALSVFEDLDEVIDQLWAEAKNYFKHGEKLYLNAELEQEAIEYQEEHSEHNPKQGLIEGYLETLLPDDWDSLGIYARQMFIHGDEFVGPKIGTVRRERVCAVEIWCELFKGDAKSLPPIQSREITDILRKIEGWGKLQGSYMFKIYKKQRGFRRL